jgi:hypothetical protein
VVNNRKLSETVSLTEEKRGNASFVSLFQKEEEGKLSVPVYTVLLNLVRKGWRWRE